MCMHASLCLYITANPASTRAVKHNQHSHCCYVMSALLLPVPQKSMDSCYEILNKHVQACQHVHKVPLTRLVKPLWEQLDLNISAAKNVERGLQAQQRRQQQQQRAAV